MNEPEWWWIERDGGLEIARVAFGDAYAEAQKPPQPWCAEVVGSELIVWPTQARLVVAVSPVVTDRRDDVVDVIVRVDADGRVTVVSPGERMRIVAAPEKLPAAAGQRVAELVAESLKGSRTCR